MSDRSAMSEILIESIEPIDLKNKCIEKSIDLKYQQERYNEKFKDCNSTNNVNSNLISNKDNLSDVNKEIIDLSDDELAVDETADITIVESRNLDIITLNIDQLEPLLHNSGRNAWLNDLIIYNYLLSKDFPNVLIVETIIFDPRFRWNSISNLRNLTRPLTYRENWEYMIFAIHKNENHWALAIAKRDGNVDYFDTMENNSLSNNERNIITRMLNGFSVSNENVIFNIVDSNTYWHQNDTYNCGVGVCMLAERYIMNENLLFTINDVLNWRISTYQYLYNIIDDGTLHAHNVTLHETSNIRNEKDTDNQSIISENSNVDQKDNSKPKRNPIKKNVSLKKKVKD